MKYNPARRKEDRGYWKIWSFLARFFTIIGIAAFISTIFISFTFFKISNYKPPALPDNIVLTYKLKPNLFETTQKPSLKGALLRPPTTLHEIAEALDIARKDDRVKAIIVDIQGVSYNMAQIQELRDAIKRFRDSGKFAKIFANDFGATSGGTKSYYFATAFDEIWMQPMGMVAITGLRSETPFIKKPMDKLGVKANFDHRGKYKSAVEGFTRYSMSDDARNMNKSIIDDLGGQILEAISKDRNIEYNKVLELINNAPHMDSEALQNKLIDRLGYYDNLIDNIKNKFGDDIEFINLLGYGFGAKTEDGDGGVAGFFSQLWHKKDPDSLTDGKNKIALIYGSGVIVPYNNKAFASSPMTAMRKPVIYTDKLTKAFSDATNNEEIAVIVFRIDSPGGSPVAAEALRRAVLKAKEKGKKVIVSMGGTAASGGYWAVVNADKIIAEPATLTGSIGVFAGKIVLDELWKKIGVNWENISFGKNSAMWSPNSEFSDSEKERFSVMLDKIYSEFIKIVAEGRGFTIEEVEKIAQGRVWTGRQAKEIGLVDELGGIEFALSEARIMIANDKNADIPILHFPERKSTLELIFQMLTEGSASINTNSVTIFMEDMPKEIQNIYDIWAVIKNLGDISLFSPLAANFDFK